MSSSALTLYRKILKLHRAMPVQMRELGDKYVRQEFKSHIYPKNEGFKYSHYETFLKSWKKYVDEMSNPEVRLYGKSLSHEELAAMSNDQKKTLNSFKEGKTFNK
jgi:hypothetical protein